eukprot:SM000040S14846  [mRNA]  locus=s40:797124:803321:+ [translate_table: standard]
MVDEFISEKLTSDSLPSGLCLVRAQVRVVADLPASYVQVDDDGSGIGRDDLELVGERHGRMLELRRLCLAIEIRCRCLAYLLLDAVLATATSKLHTLEQLEEGPTTLGFRGEALSSIAEFALLEITTRARGSPLTFCKIFKGGKTLSLGVSIHDRNYGTTVTVRDLFFNQPVRRRLFRVRPGKELQSIKERVVRHALIRPAVSFTLISDRASLQPILHVERGTPVLDILRAVHGKDLIAGWEKLDYARECLRLTGHLTVKAGRVAGKGAQYLSRCKAYDASNLDQRADINQRFVKRTPIHKLLSSWFSKHTSKGLEEARGSGALPMHLSTKGQGRPGSRQPEPSFVLNLTCPLHAYDITFEASKTYAELKDWAPVLLFVQDILDDLCKNAAKAQPANTVKKRPASCEGHVSKSSSNVPGAPSSSLISPFDSPLGRQTRKLCDGPEATMTFLSSPPESPPDLLEDPELQAMHAQDSPEELWHQLHSRDTEAAGDREGSADSPAAASEDMEDTVNSCAALEEALDQVPLRSPTAAAKDIQKIVSSSAALEGSLGALPGGVIDDGVLVGKCSYCPPDVEEKAAGKGSFGGGLKAPLDVVPSPDVGGNTPGKSIASMLLGWKNPCMRIEHEEVLTLEGPLLKGSSEGLVPKAVSRDAFQRSRVLQQVGEKFIAAVTGRVLLLIDQHAADERVQLEEMRKQILTDGSERRSVELDTPINLHVSVTEEQTLDSYRERVEHWGWRYTITEASQRKTRMSPAGCQVHLTAAPSVLGVTILAADLLEYLSQLAETQGSSTPPVPILRLLSSKACRGAIMFGDKLTRGECHLLIDHLKQTQLLFQCAHGRPTMVPLVDLSGLRTALRQPPVMPQADADPAKVRTQRWRGQPLHGSCRDSPTLNPRTERATLLRAQKRLSLAMS